MWKALGLGRGLPERVSRQGCQQVLGPAACRAQVRAPKEGQWQVLGRVLCWAQKRAPLVRGRQLPAEAARQLARA